MTRKLWLFSVILVATLLLAASSPAAAQEKAYSADRFDVDVVVEEGGSLLVTETVTYSFTGDPFTYVFRELPTDHTDGIVEIQASVDGRSYPQGDQAGQVEIKGNNPIRVTWHFEPTTGVSRQFVLSYRVLGVARQSDGGDLLLWQALPDSYAFQIAQSQVAFTYPAGVQLVGAPEVRAGVVDVAQDGRRITFNAANLQPNDPLVVALTFPTGSLITEPPAWQNRQQTQTAWIPLWLAGGAAILLVGIFVTVMQIQRIQPRSLDTRSIAYEPPNKLSPGLAAALINASAGPTWATALGTLFDLADQGVLEIDESPEKKWYRQHDFLIRLLERPSALQPHQEALLDLLFTTKKGPVKTVKFSDLSNVVSSRRWKEFTQTVKAEIKAANLVSDERKQARSRLLFTGLLLLFVALGSMITLAVGQIGAPFLIISGSLAALGIVVLIAGATITTLTDEAAQLAAEWQQFANYLRRVSRGKETIAGAHTFVKYLAFAAAFGLLPQWVRRFEKEGWTELPPYFKALPNSNPADSMAAFAAMAAASSSTTGAAGAAAGAGAAGGGAAGAG